MECSGFSYHVDHMLYVDPRSPLSYLATMESNALALLRDEPLWEEVGLTKCEANQPGLVRSILRHFITESQALGGSFLNDFWLNLGKCHPKLQENSTKFPDFLPFFQ